MMKYEDYPDMYAPQNSDCVPMEKMITDVQLAHAYVPWEKMCATFTPMRSLTAGTAFPPLYGLYPWDKNGMY